MADDLANNWGVNLGLPDKYRRSYKSPSLPMRSIAASDRRCANELSSLVKAETDQFVFERVSICGSQANSWAIDDATNQAASLCLFAAGSYVSGDASALQSYSTAEFVMGSDLVFITPPKEISNLQARENTVPLPYHIPGVMCPKQLMEYEDECLQAVHIRLCWAKMRRQPYKALLLELMLAGNGAILSNRALVAIGKLAVHHGLRIIVDEIMTGGRTGGMIYLLTKPKSFQVQVTHITLGKWCQMGIILLSKEWMEMRKTLYPVFKRGSSTLLCTDEASNQWRCVKSCLAEIPAKRGKVLKKFGLKEEDVWGQGLIMFAPCRRETMYGLKCRFLPLIHSNTPLDKFKYTLLRSKDFRLEVNRVVVDGVREWIKEEPQPKADNLSWPEEKKLDAERLIDFVLVSTLIKSYSESDEKQSADWIKLCMPGGGVNRSQGEAALSRLRNAGYLVQTQKGKKRQRNWKLKKNFIAPWKSEDFDDIIKAII